MSACVSCDEHHVTADCPVPPLRIALRRDHTVKVCGGRRERDEFLAADVVPWHRRKDEADG